MIILGLHGGITQLQHDPSATLLVDGRIVAACEEERFVRFKSALGHLPIRSINACLKIAGIDIRQVDHIAHIGVSYPDMADRIRQYLEYYFGYAPPIRLVHHQYAHLASAFFCSDFERAMCISCDGWGDEKSGAIAIGSDAGLEILDTFDKDQSLGQVYASITSFLGFSVNEDEYKVMGLAPYGSAGIDLSPIARPVPGGYAADSRFWTRALPAQSRYEPWYGDAMLDLLGAPRRHGESLTARHRDIAHAVQKTFESCLTSVVEDLHRRTGLDSLCLAGGCALNCSANLTLAQLPFIRHQFVQPAASDRGISLGAALLVAWELGERVARGLEHVYLGPMYDDDAILKTLRLTGVDFDEPADPIALAADLLAEGRIVGWFQGRSEFGPRALGNRSILANPGVPDMKDRINARVKFREEFRPFAPSVLAERADDLFDCPIEDGASPFMTMGQPVRADWRPRLPAVTHVNGTGRVQAVSRATNPRYHALIEAFDRRTGIPAVLNTSFNVRGEPIVETPLNALATFTASGLDALFIGPFMIRKPRQPGL